MEKSAKFYDRFPIVLRSKFLAGYSSWKNSKKNEFAFSQYLLTFISTKMLSERGHDSMCWEIGTEHFCWPFVNEIVEFLQGKKTSN